MKSFWSFDRNGRVLVDSRTYPAPPVDYSDRDYFKGSRSIATSASFAAKGTLRRSRVFELSRCRLASDGQFNGVI